VARKRARCICVQSTNDLPIPITVALSVSGTVLSPILYV
jgi:hypothetical protein